MFNKGIQSCEKGYNCKSNNEESKRNLLNLLCVEAKIHGETTKKECSSMFEGRVEEFKELYVGTLDGNLKADNTRKSILTSLSSVSLFGDMGELVTSMGEYFTKTQKLMYMLIKNKIQIGINMYYTQFGDTGFFVDTFKGEVYTVNINKHEVIITSNFVAIRNFRSFKIRHIAKFNSGMGFVTLNLKDTKGFLNNGYSCKGSAKGAGSYRSIVRKYDYFGGKSVNLKVHTLIYGMQYGYKVLLTQGTNKIYTINHIDEFKCNNKIMNLEFVTQKENVRHSLKRRKKYSVVRMG